MKAMFGFAINALLAAASLRAATLACADATAPMRVELVFPTRRQARIRYRGRLYVATLISWPDAWHDITTIDLDLRRPGQRSQWGLLSPPGNWHGMQPFMFVPTDLAGSPEPSAYPNPRLIPIQGTGDDLEITMVGFRAHPTGTELISAFDELRLSLAIRPDPSSLPRRRGSDRPPATGRNACRRAPAGR